MSLEIVRGNITDMQDIDAVVLSHDPFVEGLITMYGPDVCKLLEGRKKLGTVPSDSLEITCDSEENSKYVIYTLEPLWVDGNHNEEPAFRQCIEQSLWLALMQGCKSIAFSISTVEFFGFPKMLARQIAEEMFFSFLSEHKMQIYLFIPCEKSFELSQELMDSLESYIEANYVQETTNLQHDLLTSYKMAYYIPTLPKNYDHDKTMKDINDLITNPSVEFGFTTKLSELMTKYNKKGPDIYEKVDMSRQNFNKELSNPNWRPKKENAIKIAIALELDIEETLDLIGRAGYYLIPNSKSDLIIKFFIENKIYDYEIVKEALKKYNLYPI